MSRFLSNLRAYVDMSPEARRREQLLRVARAHRQAAADFAEIGDTASAKANLWLAARTMAVRERGE